MNRDHWRSSTKPLATFILPDLQVFSRIMNRKGVSVMLWTIFVILAILWLLGMVSGVTMGGFIHLLLVIAIVVVLLRVIQGRRAL